MALATSRTALALASAFASNPSASPEKHKPLRTVKDNPIKAEATSLLCHL